MKDILIQDTYEIDSKVIGRMFEEDNELKVEFYEPRTKEEIFNILGNVGIRLEVGGTKGDSYNSLWTKGTILRYARITQ